MKSKTALIISTIVLVWTSLFYYPRYNKPGSEATISWDVSGYYWYLPSIFIYKDVKMQGFAPKIFEKYAPTPEVQQYFKNRNGAYVMKYSIGQAVLYSPFFFISHIAAPIFGYEQDGFSLPYQLGIQIGSLLIALLGLFYLRKVLLFYFKDSTVGWVLLAYALGSNYLNYAAIDSAMTHNWLFTTYTLLIYATIKFYQNSTWIYAIFIGLLVGINALVRPTDIIAVIIPVLWGMNDLTIDSIKSRIGFLWQNNKLIISAAILTALVGFIQLAYYKYAGEEWFIYSYQDQTFSWFKPHFNDFIFSFRSGWLIYSPLFFLAIFGFFLLRQKNIGWVAITFFSIINLYIVCAWDIWWYGARAMVQSYPILAFPLATLVEKSSAKKWSNYLVIGFIGICIYINLWWTHGIHKGAYYDAFNGTKAYFYKTVGRWNIPAEYQKLYDTKEYFDGERKNVKEIYTNNFDSDSLLILEARKINGTTSEFVNAAKQFTKAYEIPIKNDQAKWIRVKNTFKCGQKEWNFWLMTQVVVKFYNGNQEVKVNIYRPQRLLIDGQQSDLYFDVKIPKEIFTKAEVFYWNSDGQKEFLMDNLVVETFDE
jgi:hypothetical protein